MTARALLADVIRANAPLLATPEGPRAMRCMLASVEDYADQPVYDREPLTDDHADAERIRVAAARLNGDWPAVTSARRAVLRAGNPIARRGHARTYARSSRPALAGTDQNRTEGNAR
jgi:hypothetical protein